MLIYNTLGRKKEEIKPLGDNLIRIYTCGPTVYDYAHIGNLRKYVFDDLLKRSLEYFGFKIKHVMNITDVGHLTSDADEGEDKIEKGAEREKKTAWEIARVYEAAFLKDLKELNIETPEIICRATEHIKEQIDLILILEEKGFTYKTSDGVYFNTSKLSDYGKLAGLQIENLKEGARVEKNKEKKNPTDFALWKFSSSVIARRSLANSGQAPQSHRQMEWPSPWGVGFPGWHIECSAMSTKYLGQPFEIHTGGVDLISVHHTNEIAQSEAAYGKPLAKYWVHSEHLLQDGHRMAKSAGHFIRLKDLESRGFSPLDFRYFCLTANYRTKLDFTWNHLEAAKNSYKNIKNFTQNLGGKNIEGEEEFYKKALSDFYLEIGDDLNTARALAILFDTIGEANKRKYLGRAAQEFIENIDKVLGLNLVEIDIIPQDVLDFARKREELRLKKDFKQADEVREKIEEMGYRVEDLQDGGIRVLTK